MKQVTMALLLGCLFAAGCDRPQQVGSDAVHFHRSIEASNQATRLTNQFTTSGRVPSPQERDAILHHTRVALEHAHLVRDAGLVRMHDDMPRMYRDRFERGLRTVAQGLESRSPALMAEGHLHLDKWADWLEANAHEIRFPPRPPATEPTPASDNT